MYNPLLIINKEFVRMYFYQHSLSFLSGFFNWRGIKNAETCNLHIVLQGKVFIHQSVENILI